MTARGKWLDGLGCGEHKKKRHLSSSLNEVITTENGQEIEVGERIVGLDDLEDKVISRLDAQRIYRELPHHIKLLVKKRFQGEPLTHKEKEQLFKSRQELRSKYPEYRYRAVARTRSR